MGIGVRADFLRRRSRSLPPVIPAKAGIQNVEDSADAARARLHNTPNGGCAARFARLRKANLVPYSSLLTPLSSLFSLKIALSRFSRA